MSGKSTLLRAVGINTVLAMAGAPVRAASLRMTPLRVGASIQVNDSLQEGRSRFYSEILRLRAICALAEEQPPVLFLLDELLDGTNSSDRLTGAKGIAHALLASGAIGLISTHDLALTAIEEDAHALRNVHFEERIEDDEMHFDFKLRDGVVTTRNGVALMRMVGLKV
jgi:DNA mismatch repair ATPase MutS